MMIKQQFQNFFIEPAPQPKVEKPSFNIEDELEKSESDTEEAKKAAISSICKKNAKKQPKKGKKQQQISLQEFNVVTEAKSKACFATFDQDGNKVNKYPADLTEAITLSRKDMMA